MATDAGAAAFADAEVGELVRFQDKDGFLALQKDFLEHAVNGDNTAVVLLQGLEMRLDMYQEQPYLLDPLLGELVSPPAETIQSYVKSRPNTSDTLTSTPLALCCRLLYAYTKVRGAKVISLFLTHEVADLVPVLRLIEAPGQPSWQVTYILLLWLGLICLIPFTLGDVADLSSIESVARRHIHCSGRERDAAAILLGNLYRRRDIGSEHFVLFLDWARNRLRENTSAFEATGILQTLCNIVQNGDSDFVRQHLDDIAAVLDEYVSLGTRNTLIDRFRAKLTCRLALRIIESNTMPNNVDDRVDVLVDELLRALQHPDSSVRYSGAKGIGRVCATIPPYFAAQVVAAVLGLMSDNIPGVPQEALSLTSASHSTTVQDALDSATIDAVSDSTWNGVLLAIAELIRRTKIPANMLGRTFTWVLRALFFEQQRGLGAIGTNVRDSACYVLWAAARLPTDSLQPFARPVSARLGVVMTLDREVTIRRAASAAFQEWVGRTSLVPHGIEVLREADFSAVGIRRNAYVVCAPRIATFSFFCVPIHSHLINTCLKHWDVSVRTLGAKAAAQIAAEHESLLPGAIAAHRAAACSLDSAAVHGALCALAELTQRMYVPESVKIATSVSPRMYHVPGASLILAAACEAAAGGWEQQKDEKRTDQVWHLVEAASRFPDTHVHVAVAALVHALRREPSVESYLGRIDKWNALSVEEQRCDARALGSLAETHADRIDAHLGRLLVESPDAEVRANAAASLGAAGKYVCNERLEQVTNDLVKGLNDYAVDDRGDVGSWVRLASMRALGDIATTRAVSEVALESICVGISTQLVERIDAVRVEAATQFGRIAKTRHIPGQDVLVEIDGHPGFESSVRLISVEIYRLAMLRGLAHSIGGKSETIAHEAAAALQMHMVDAEPVFSGIARLAAASVRENRGFIALMRTAYVLIEDGRQYRGIDRALVRLVRLASISPDKIKSVPRLLTCARLYVTTNSVAAALQYSKGADVLPLFLGHKFPAVRSTTSEAVCVSIQSREPSEATCEAEDLLLHTEWCAVPLTRATDAAASAEAAHQIAALLH